MREQRSASQILFGFLPDQTVDIGGGVWKVKRWTDPVPERRVDSESLRDELIKLAWRWSEADKDGGFVDDLRRGATINVKSLNRERGVWCESFPSNWVCRQCNRIHRDPRTKCQCGSRLRKSQLPFVGYHDACGSLRAPWIPRCKTHDQVAVRFPGTASAEELVFECPICARQIRRGFAGATCDCSDGGRLRFTVHRAASVYTPRPVVLVNPPHRDSLDRLRQAGGASVALDWVVAGLPGRWLDHARPQANLETTRNSLIQLGYSKEVVENMLRATGISSDTQAESEIQVKLPRLIEGEAQSQAQTIALALLKSRITQDDLKKSVPADSSLGQRYAIDYPREMKRAGIERIELIDAFPILTAQFGYTRGEQEAGASRLKAFRESDGSYTVYGESRETEALFVRLSPSGVANWLRSHGINLRATSDDFTAASEIMTSFEIPQLGDPSSGNELGRLVTTLIHTFAHRFVRQASVFAGIERNALSELLVPLHLGFFIYAAAKGDFVLGGLQALFESDLDSLLRTIVGGEHRCALDPGCAEGGSSCAVCIQLGEPSCRMFNTMLSREMLAGTNGYFNQFASAQPI